MTGSDVRRRMPLSPIALAVAIGVATQTLLPLPWSPIESAEAHQQSQQCSPSAAANNGADGGFDGGCCNCDGAGSGDGGGDGGK